MSARFASAVGLFASAAALLAPSPALAEVGPIQLVSKSATEQAAEASAPALSADGRYIAFQGVIGGLAGVFRNDLTTGAIAPVAAGAAFEGNLEVEAVDASAPSISADGRYVSFTTAARLDPADDLQQKSSDVYVADMAASPPTYELASARDGCDPDGGVGGCGLTYSGGSLPGNVGSRASSRVALSADGREVAFVTTAKSDLTAAVPGDTETPAGQVVLRDLDANRTTLVSAARDPASGAMEPGVPIPGGAVMEMVSLPGLIGAALSADGTTVAWLGAHLPAQVPLLADERQAITEEDGLAFPYDEPLWRRVSDGPQAPTRRIVGGGDPPAPGCPPDGTLADPACQGPFPGILAKNPSLNSAMGWIGLPGVDGVPQLSADGRTVALIGNPEEATNIFLVDMREGLTRKQAIHPLTRQVPVNPTEESSVINVEPFVPLNGHIYDLALTADGQRIAFATARQQFPLAPPNLITQPPSSLGLVELYLIDLENGTLRRLSHGFGGLGEASLAATGTGEGGQGATSPTLDAAGRLIGFASTASNLVENDGNDSSDVFLVENDESPRVAGTVDVSPPPQRPAPKRRRRLALSAFSLPNGNVELVAVVPAPGRVRVSAGTALTVGSHPHLLAVAAARAKRSGAVKLTLALHGRYRHFARSREGLYAVARVSFSARKGRKLRGKLQIRFHAHRVKHAGKRKR